MTAPQLREQVAAWTQPNAALEDLAGGTWRARWPACAAAGFAVEVEAGPQTLRVALGPWVIERSATDEDSSFEISDLLAGGLFGRIRLQLEQGGGRDLNWRAEVEVERAWVLAAQHRSLRLAFWRRPAWVMHRNDYEPPADLCFGSAGRLPNLPWVGVLAVVGSAQARDLPLDGELDLHLFRPKEVAKVVLAYIEACHERGVLELRLVHGKGKGQLRRTVHHLLERHEAVHTFRLGGHAEGSWGATIVTLRAPGSSAPAKPG